MEGRLPFPSYPACGTFEYREAADRRIANTCEGGVSPGIRAMHCAGVIGTHGENAAAMASASLPASALNAGMGVADGWERAGPGLIVGDSCRSNGAAAGERIDQSAHVSVPPPDTADSSQGGIQLNEVLPFQCCNGHICELQERV